MSTRSANILAVVVVVAVASGCGPKAPAPQSESTTKPTAESSLLQRNHNERTGPSWSPRDLEGPNGQLLEIGSLAPGAFGEVKAGENIDTAIAAGYLEEDKHRPCDGGPFYKWRDQWSGGMDVIVGENKRIDYLGLSKDGLETAEGISIGNSYGALKATYGGKLSAPVTMDYGQPGVFIEEGTRWLGFLLDASPDSLSDKSRIKFIEVSDGRRPGLARDGC